MCRSSAEGGRRCSGRNRSSAGGQAPAASRRFDGKPETEKDKRFFDLRRSGYTGPIDQDGHRAHLEGTGRDARIVRDVA